MLNAKLMVVGGDAKQTEVQLHLPTVIGRGREASLTLPHPLVSRRHTEIFEQDGRLMVRDLGSLNGTFVNNRRIKNDQVLEPNQLLTLGNVTFRAVYDVADLSEGESPAAAQSIEVSDGVAKVTQEEDTEARAQKTDNRSTGPLESNGKQEPTAQAKPKIDTSSASARIISATSSEPVSVSSLSGLPDPASSAIELAEPLDPDAQPQAVSSIDPDEFQFDEDGNASAIDPSQSDLGSFLRKLPR